MILRKRIPGASALCALALACAVPASWGSSIEAFLDRRTKRLEAAVPGRFNLDSRLRYEHFDLENGSPVRDGFSHRLRYGYTTPAAYGLRAMVEGETLYALGDSDDIHPADQAGSGTELNQVWVDYSNEEVGTLRLGRQVYTLDDHRFIGHVGWRQNIQSFDALTGSPAPLGDLSLKAFILDKVHTVTGADNELDAFGFNGAYAFSPGLQLTAFVYNIKNRDAPVQSNLTYGARAAGSRKTSSFSLDYAVSLARQEDSGNAPVSFESDYIAGEATLDLNAPGITMGAGFEILEAGFRTPLATLHKFNGFADVFAGASGVGIPDGLRDYYLSAAFKVPVGTGRMVPVKIIHHWFEPESGSGKYGQELDLQVTYTINPYLKVIGKAGFYDSSGGSGGVGSVDKTMGALELNFVY